jgi:predicted transcriptional regulator
MQHHAAATDDEEDAAKHAAIERAMTSLDQGRGVPHDVVRDWLLDLARGIRAPIPTAKDDDAAPRT